MFKREWLREEEKDDRNIYEILAYRPGERVALGLPHADDEAWGPGRRGFPADYFEPASRARLLEAGLEVDNDADPDKTT
jgi:hypothetical protein